MLSLSLSESDSWSTMEIEAYQQALQKHDKDFFLVAQMVSGDLVLLLLYKESYSSFCLYDKIEKTVVWKRILE